MNIPGARMASGGLTPRGGLGVGLRGSGGGEYAALPKAPAPLRPAVPSLLLIESCRAP